MFTKFSQIRKTLSDEIENVMKQGMEGPGSGNTSSSTSIAGSRSATPGAGRGRGPPRESVATLKDNAKILNTETPDPDSLVVQADGHDTPEGLEETSSKSESDIKVKDSSEKSTNDEKKSENNTSEKQQQDNDEDQDATKSKSTKETDSENVATKDGDQDGKSGKSNKTDKVNSTDKKDYNKEEDSSTLVPVSGQMVVIDGYTVPKEVAPKLRKFKKYEAKYPSKFIHLSFIILFNHIDYFFFSNKSV